MCRLAFILPSGRFCYLRIPQGLNASSEEWCRRSDAIVEDLPWARKIVDDILIWAPDLPTLKTQIEEISQRSLALNVVLSKKKFIIGEELPFAGYIVSKNGVRPNQGRVSAIRRFPIPKDQTGIKSFLGLANQLNFSSLILHTIPDTCVNFLARDMFFDGYLIMIRNSKQ